MLDHMTMPALFTILVALLAVVSAGLFFVFRIVGERAKSSDEDPTRRR